jgi:hypothetical protein
VLFALRNSCGRAHFDDVESFEKRIEKRIRPFSSTIRLFLMGIRCGELHCLEIVPDHLFADHKDRHLAERLAAEEFEQQTRQRNQDEELAHQLQSDFSEDYPSSYGREDLDYQLALDLNRQYRDEEAERSFRLVQVNLLVCIN